MRKRLPLAERLKKGLQEALAFEKGELELRRHAVEIPDPASSAGELHQRPGLGDDQPTENPCTEPFFEV
jgi:hypothetical protein